MRTYFIRLIILFVALVCVRGMCTKNEETAGKSRTDLISSGNWYFSAYTADPAIDYDGDGTKETDLLSVMPQCHKDNYYLFRADGTGEFNYGVQKCANDPQSIPYKWSFIENESKIKLDNGSIYQITILNENQLQMVLPGTIKHTLTFSH